MNLANDIAAQAELHRGAHACWLVDDSTRYCEVAAAILDEGDRLGQKLVVFGPTGSAPLRELATPAAIAVDPHVAFLGEGPLVPEAMFAMFREQTALAHASGYRSLCLVADMDWLLPANPSATDIVAFEVLLDRLVAELDATVVCAYRSSSFDTEAIDGALAVHPLVAGAEAEPQFRFVWEGTETWRIAGEVDLGARPAFAAALDAVVADRPCVLDVADLAFVDIAALRAIADAARLTQPELQLSGASPMFRRLWKLAKFDEAAPAVHFATTAR